MNDSFYSEPYQLWRVANVHLPAVANAYARVSQLAEATEVERSAAYELFPGVGTAFGRLRMDVQAIMARSSTNLHETGDALSIIAWEFAETDEGNAEEILRTEISDLRSGEQDPNMAEPPVRDLVPTDPYPERTEAEEAGRDV